MTALKQISHNVTKRRIELEAQVPGSLDIKSFAARYGCSVQNIRHDLAFLKRATRDGFTHDAWQRRKRALRTMEQISSVREIEIDEYDNVVGVVVEHNGKLFHIP